MRKFVQRHKGPVLAGSLLALMLIGGIAGTASQASRANVQASRANEEARRASAEAGRANEQAVRATAEAARANKERELAIAAGNAKEWALAKQNAIRREAMDTVDTVMNNLIEQQFARQATLSDADKSFCRLLGRHFREFATVDFHVDSGTRLRSSVMYSALITSSAAALTSGIKRGPRLPLSECREMTARVSRPARSHLT